MPKKTTDNVEEYGSMDSLESGSLIMLEDYLEQLLEVIQSSLNPKINGLMDMMEKL